MILRLDPAGVPRMVELDDLHRLHCELNDEAAQPDRIAQALAGVAEVVYPATVWIDIAWMRQQGVNLDTSWPQNFDRMIAGARPHGWVSHDGLRVKAHVLWTDASTNCS